MRKSIRLFAVLSAFILLLGISACADTSEPSRSGASEAVTESAVPVIFSRTDGNSATHLPTAHTYSIDEELAAALEAAVSRTDTSSAYDKARDQWISVMNACLEGIYATYSDKASPEGYGESICAAVKQSQSDWEAAFKIAEANYFAELQAFYGNGTAPTIWMAKFCCEQYRTRALELYDLYSHCVTGELP